MSVTSFASKYEADLFKSDKKTIDTQKVLFSLWKNRFDLPHVTNVIQVFSKFIDEKRVYNEVEFYLPQLAHLIIHLDDVPGSNVLEDLLINLAKTSTHTALFLSFILVASIEDYQPENADGKKNEHVNINRFFRCARMLKNIEHVIVYRDLSLISSTTNGSHTSLNHEIISFDPLEKDDNDYRKAGFLLYKRVKRKSNMSTKPWKRRYFSVHHRILSCYRNVDDRIPLRSILLTGCSIITEVEGSKYNWAFQLYNPTSYIRFNLRAADEDSYNSWIEFLETQINKAPKCVTHDGDSFTQAESNRFNFFHQQRLFVSNLCEISERLRFQDREVRKYFLRHDMSNLVLPPFSYIPLCTSLSPFRCVLRSLPKEGYAFNTKARCPALMMFEVEEHPLGADTAGFLAMELHDYDDHEILEQDSQQFHDDFHTSEKKAWDSTINSPNNNSGNTDDIMPPSHLALKESKYNRMIAAASAKAGYWSKEGTGLKRIGGSNISSTTALSPYTNVSKALSDTSSPNKNGASVNTNTSKSTPNMRSPPPSYGVSSPTNSNTTANSNNNNNNNNNDTPELSVDSSDIKYELESDSTSSTGSNNGTMKSSSLLFESTTSLSTMANTTTDTSMSLNKTDKPATSESITPLMNKETFEAKSERLRKLSPYGHLPHWRLMGLIAKSNDDVRQEVFVMQLIMYYQMAFKQEKIPVWLHTYRILSTSKTTGLIQLIPNAVSIDGLKKEDNYPGSLRQYFEYTYGAPTRTSPEQDPLPLRTAIEEYVKSMAGYSIVTYLLAIKDRHNGNIMIDMAGHMIHIDFGFVFGLAPGKAFSLETAPFKLTQEMVDVMGGIHSSYFEEYIKLCTKAFLVARKHAQAVTRLMEIMSYCSLYPSFSYNKNAIKDFRKRLLLDLPDSKIGVEVRKLIDKSYSHRGTIYYDQFQLATNGIAP